MGPGRLPEVDEYTHAAITSMRSDHTGIARWVLTVVVLLFAGLIGAFVQVGQLDAGLTRVPYLLRVGVYYAIAGGVVRLAVRRHVWPAALLAWGVVAYFLAVGGQGVDEGGPAAWLALRAGFVVYMLLPVVVASLAGSWLVGEVLVLDELEPARERAS